MTEELSDFPAYLRDTEKMPWEMPVSPVRWEWGADRGKPLSDIDSRELLRKREWLLQRNGAGTYFDFLVAEIDVVLFERQGL